MKLQMLFLLISLFFVSCVIGPKNKDDTSMSVMSLPIKIDSSHLQIPQHTQVQQPFLLKHHIQDTAILMHYQHIH